MSRENVEAMYALVDRWNTGERDLVADYCDPTFELQSPFSSVVGEPYRGYAGIEQWAPDVDEQFAEWHISLDEVRQIRQPVIASVASTGGGVPAGRRDFCRSRLLQLRASTVGSSDSYLLGCK